MKIKNILLLLLMISSWEKLLGEVTDVVSAFNHLNSASAMFPNGRSTEDRKALELLRAQPDEARRLLISTLSKGGRRGRPDVDSLLPFLVSEEDKPKVIREIVASYEPNDLATPFLGHLAYFGDSQDMARLRQYIVAHPNSVEAFELGRAIIDSRNPSGTAMLLELWKTTPGKWRESFEMKRAFEGSRSPDLTMANSQNPTPVAASRAPATSASDVDFLHQRFWLWSVAFVLFVGAAIWIKRR